MKKIIMSTVLFILPISCFASTASQVNSWFNNMNYSNVTNPGVYEGQSARYATLGGISTRAPITQPFQFVSVQTPKISAGCGGIDIYTGGFSAINADQFVQNLRAIGQNAQSLAFMVAIGLVSPVLEDKMSKLNKLAQDFMSNDMTSCEAAQKVVGGAMETFGVKKGNCIVKRMDENGEDYNTASYKCTTGSSMASTESTNPNKVAFVKGNLAWQVMMQDSFFTADPAFAEVVMNITGTVIVTNATATSDSRMKVRQITPALAEGVSKERFENIVNALLQGTNATDNIKLYRCSPSASASETGCDTVTDALQTVVPNWTGLYKKIETLTAGILSKIKNDTALTASEKGLISSSRIPVYRLLSSASTYYPSDADVQAAVSKYNQIIAKDILLRAVSAIIQRIDEGSGSMKNGIAGTKELESYRNNLEKVLNGLSIQLKKNSDEAEKLIEMQDEIIRYEKNVLVKLSTGLSASSKFTGQ